MMPAIFLSAEGRVVKDGCESCGITMTLDGEQWYGAIAIGAMCWLYVPIPHPSASAFVVSVHVVPTPGPTP